MAKATAGQRKGFFTEAEIKTVLAALPDDGLRDFVEWASETGQRKNEVSSLTWAMVDGNQLFIPGDICKNRTARTIALGPELLQIIARREKARRVLSMNRTPELAEYIFHRDGRKIGDFKKSWQTATIAAGVGKMVCEACEWEGAAKHCPHCEKPSRYSGKVLHDFRRTVARRLLAAGVAVPIAKKLMGMESDSMIERYGLAGEAELLLQAQKKVARFRKSAA